jgi:hypothetical protein
MASTYVNDLRLNEMATGDGSGTWGTTTNTNLELIGEAMGYGTEGITTNADAHTTTVADGATDPGRAMYLEYTGTLDSACTITIAPNTINRVQFIENGTSGSQNIIISQGSGANITIPPGDVKAVYLDGAGSGAAVVDAFASLNVVDLKVQDDLTVTDDATIGGTLGVTGIVTLTDDLIIGDGKTIGSASDVDAITIASNGQLTLTQTLIGTALDISGDIDVDGTSNLDIVDIDGAVNMATTALVTGVLTTTAATVFNGGFASNADSTMGTDKKIQFRDTAIHISSSTDGQLDLVADTEIQIAATTIDINGAINASGEIIAASLDISGNVDVDGVLETDNLTVGGAQGTDGQVLTSTGSGVGWEDASSGATDINGLSDAKTFGTSSVMLGDATTGTIDAANYNTGLGVDVFAALTSGDNNTSVGFASLDANTTGHSNVAVGFNAGGAVTSGTNNVLLGKNSGDAITTGAVNTAIGDGSLGALTASTNPNVAVGGNALTTMTDGDGGNTACGYRTLEALTTGSGNTALGLTTALAITTATNNTLLGLSAGQAVTTGGDNNCMGNASGVEITTGANNVCLGTSSGTTNNPGGAITTGSNQIAIGNASSANAHIQIDWTVASDKRDKTDVTPLDMGLDFINKLEPVTYKWDKRAKYEEGNTPDGTHKESWTDVGFLAQDVEEIEAEFGHKINDETNLTTYMSEDKDSYGLTYAKFVPMLVKAVQELSTEVEELKIKLGDK